MAFAITNLEGILIVFPGSRSMTKTVELPDMDQGGFASWEGTGARNIERALPFILTIGTAGTGGMCGRDPESFDGDEGALEELRRNQHLFLVYMQVDYPVSRLIARVTSLLVE